MQLSARIGGARVESVSLTEVTLDPVIATLLGESVAIQAAYRLNYAPDMQVHLADTFRRSQFTLAYSDQVNPGNGIYSHPGTIPGAPFIAIPACTTGISA